MVTLKIERETEKLKMSIMEKVDVSPIIPRNSVGDRSSIERV